MIRRAGPADVETVAEIEHLAFGASAWSARLVAEELARPDATVLLWHGSGGPEGYVGVRVLAGEAEIFTIAVRPDRRRAGIATALLDAVESLVRSLGAEAVHLEVAEDNAAARALYTARGYREVGRRRGYYGPNEDAVLMTLGPHPGAA